MIDVSRQQLSRTLTAVLFVAVLMGLIGIVYLAVTPYQQTDPHTEFYVLGPDGAADGYPSNLTVSETGRFILGVTNNEHQETTYTAVIEHEDGFIYRETLTLADGETWEDEIEISFDEPGEHRLEILLYLGEDVGDDEEPYRELWMTIDVTAEDEE